MSATLTDGMRAKLQADYLALARLALTQRRLSWKARREAIEAEERADLATYRAARAEARRLWRDAIWHLFIAQDKKAQLHA